MRTANPRNVGEADKAIGQRIRAARLAKGISQDKLGQALGLSFQQVQKYEKGSNRVGAGRLGMIATTLNVPVTHLLGADEAPASAATLTLMTTREGQALAESFNAISNPISRKLILDLARTSAAADAMLQQAAE